jgi:hypothetical protein
VVEQRVFEAPGVPNHKDLHTDCLCSDHTFLLGQSSR